MNEVSRKETKTLIHKITSSKEAKRIFDENEASGIFVAGAGEHGDYIGQFLYGKGYQWRGYVDQASGGYLNDKPIYGYGDSFIKDASCYIISSQKYEDSIVESLRAYGIKDNNIYSIEDSLTVFDLCGEVNSLMRKLQEGDYVESSYGERDPDKTYMIIQRRDIYDCIYADFNFFLTAIDYADKMGFIPVIDRKAYPSLSAINLERLGYDNSWTLYYKQPGGVELDYVQKDCKNVRVYNWENSKNNYIRLRMEWKHNDYTNKKRFQYLTKKYYHLTDELQDRVDKEYNLSFPKKGKVLGVSVREGMIVQVKAKVKYMPNHHRQPSVEQILHDAKSKLEEWNYDYIFLMCETNDTVRAFQDVFGSKLIYTNRERREMSDEDYLLSTLGQNYHLRDNVKRVSDYVVEVNLFCKCDSVISPFCSAMIACNFIKDGEYEHKVFYYVDNKYRALQY